MKSIILHSFVLLLPHGLNSYSGGRIVHLKSEGREFESHFSPLIFRQVTSVAHIALDNTNSVSNTDL